MKKSILDRLKNEATVLEKIGSLSEIAPHLVQARFSGKSGWMLTEYIPGELLGRLVTTHNVKEYKSKIIHVFKICRRMKLNGYGYLDGDLHGKFKSWPGFLESVYEKQRPNLKKIFPSGLREKINKKMKFSFDWLNLQQGCLLHRDINLANMILANHRIYLVDWENAIAGDPLVDVAIFSNRVKDDLFRSIFQINTSDVERFRFYKIYFGLLDAIYNWKLQLPYKKYAEICKREIL